MRKHFLLLMLMALLPMVGFAAELVNSTQYTNDGYQYKIETMTKTGDTWSGTVSVSQSNWAGKAANPTTITIKPTIKINVKGEVSGDAVDGEVTFKVVKITEDAFKDLEQVTTIVFEKDCNVNVIEDRAFAGTSIAKLDLTNTKITVLNKLFEDGNVELKKVILPATLTELASNALANCIQLGIHLDGEETDGVDFSKCTKLKTLGAGSLSNTVVKSYDFSKCWEESKNGKGEHTVYTSFLNFSDTDNPFVNNNTKTNKNLVSVILPMSNTAKAGYSPVNKIGTTFANCEALTTITNLDKSQITAVADGAFANDIALIELTFPNTLKTVEGAPFNGCMKLATLNFDATAMTALGDGTHNLFGDFKHVIAWPSTTEDFKSPLKTLNITVANGGNATLTIAAGAFASATDDQNALETVNIAVAGTFKGIIAAGAITLAPNANSAVTFGNIDGATFNSIVGPVGTYTSTLTMGAYKSTLTSTYPIVSNIISLATINGKVSQADVLDAIGQARSIDFKDNLTVALAVPTKANAVLTTLNFNSIELIEAPTDGSVPVGPAIVAETFDEANAPLLTSVTWNPLADTPENPSTAVIEKRVRNYAAFAKEAFGTKEMKSDAKVTLHTTPAIADGFYHMLESNLYNVIFDAEALDAEPTEITVLGTEGATYYYGKFTAEDANMSIANKTDDGDQVVVYSAFVDGKEQNIYMDPLAQRNDNFIVAKGHSVIVRVKRPTTTEDNMIKGVATGKKSKVMAYDATGQYDTMRSVFVAPSTTAVLNDLKVTDKVFSSDYIGTNFVGKVLYFMANPAVVGKLEWDPVGEDSYLAKGAMYVVTDRVAAAPASQLNIIWLDGTEDFTGIIEKLNSGKAGANSDVIYNLQGVRVSDMSQKGIYIKNGKKFIVK